VREARGEGHHFHELQRLHLVRIFGFYVLVFGFRILRFGFCVLCILYFVFCILCFVLCILCLVSCVLCLVSCVLCLVTFFFVSCFFALWSSVWGLGVWSLGFEVWSLKESGAIGCGRCRARSGLGGRRRGLLGFRVGRADRRRQGRPVGRRPGEGPGFQVWGFQISVKCPEIGFKNEQRARE